MQTQVLMQWSFQWFTYPYCRILEGICVEAKSCRAVEESIGLDIVTVAISLCLDTGYLHHTTHINLEQTGKVSSCGYISMYELRSSQQANVRTLYVQARTYRFGTDNIRNESFLDIRVRMYNVHTQPYVQCTYIAVHTMYIHSCTYIVRTVQYQNWIKVGVFILNIRKFGSECHIGFPYHHL